MALSGFSDTEMASLPKHSFNPAKRLLRAICMNLKAISCTSDNVVMRTSFKKKKHGITARELMYLANHRLHLYQYYHVTAGFEE